MLRVKSCNVKLNSENVFRYLEKTKKPVILCPSPPQNVKLRTFTSQSCNDGKEMYKKALCSCKVVVLLI